MWEINTLNIISHSVFSVCFRLKRNLLAKVNTKLSSLIPKVRNMVQVIKRPGAFNYLWLLDTTHPGPYLLG